MNDLEALLKEQGFESVHDFKQISDQLIALGVSVFTQWRDEDGTKAGALKLLDDDRAAKWPKCPTCERPMLSKNGEWYCIDHGARW